MGIDEILKQIEEAISQVIAKNAETIDAKAIWPEENMRMLQELGLAGLVIPKKFGGLGLGLEALSQVSEKIGEACPSTALCFGMHCVGSAVLAAKTTEAHSTILDDINRGQHITTLALSETGSGAQFYFPQTKLEKRNQQLLINGHKHFVTNGGQADSYVISVCSEEEDLGHDFSCILLPANQKGMSWGDPWDGFGMRGNQSRLLTLEDIVLPEDHLLGHEGDQIWYIFNVVAPYFLMAMSGTYLGIASAAIKEAKAHMMHRRHQHDNQSLSQISILQHRYGTLWAKVQRTRQLVFWAAREADQGGEHSLPALCSAKAEVAECSVDVVNEAMTLCGGIGYRDNSRLSRMLRDARAAHVMSPTTDLLRLWTGRTLLDEPIL